MTREDGLRAGRLVAAARRHARRLAPRDRRASSPSTDQQSSRRGRGLQAVGIRSSTAPDRAATAPRVLVADAEARPPRHRKRPSGVIDHDDAERPLRPPAVAAPASVRRLERSGNARHSSPSPRDGRRHRRARRRPRPAHPCRPVARAGVRHPLPSARLRRPALLGIHLDALCSLQHHVVEPGRRSRSSSGSRRFSPGDPPFAGSMPVSVVSWSSTSWRDRAARPGTSRG